MVDAAEIEIMVLRNWHYAIEDIGDISPIIDQMMSLYGRCRRKTWSHDGAMRQAGNYGTLAAAQGQAGNYGTLAAAQGHWRDPETGMAYSDFGNYVYSRALASLLLWAPISAQARRFGVNKAADVIEIFLAWGFYLDEGQCDTVAAINKDLPALAQFGGVGGLRDKIEELVRCTQELDMVLGATRGAEFLPVQVTNVMHAWAFIVDELRVAYMRAGRL